MIVFATAAMNCTLLVADRWRPQCSAQHASYLQGKQVICMRLVYEYVNVPLIFPKF